MNFTITLNGKKTIIQAQPSEDLYLSFGKKNYFPLNLVVEQVIAVPALFSTTENLYPHAKFR